MGEDTGKGKKAGLRREKRRLRGEGEGKGSCGLKVYLERSVPRTALLTEGERSK